MSPRRHIWTWVSLAVAFAVGVRVLVAELHHRAMARIARKRVGLDDA
ncbi:MAG: hypothetical protein V4617_15260 [Gemmatimonadota bacterium]